MSIALLRTLAVSSSHPCCVLSHVIHLSDYSVVNITLDKAVDGQRAANQKILTRPSLSLSLSLSHRRLYFASVKW